MGENEHCAVFLDGGYLRTVTRLLNSKIDLEKLTDDLARQISCKRHQTFYYDCPPHQSGEPSEEERDRYAKGMKFLHSVELLPRFTVRLGRLQKIPGPKPFIQKGVDTLISIDLLRLAYGKQIRSAVLVSSDSDFVPVVKAAREVGCTVYAAYSCDNYGKRLIHENLRTACDDRIEMTPNYLSKFALGISATRS